MSETIVVTGGAGFIGSNFILQWVAAESEPVINIDLLTYAGNLGNLRPLQGNERHHFLQGDICDRQLLKQVFRQYSPVAIVHFAAESHVDRSILGPEEFVRTNIQGTFSLLDEAKQYWMKLSDPDRDRFRFVHVSTDEVYGSLAEADPPFNENTPYAPNSPYAASKAASDHLVRAYFHTYGLPVITTNCSNNYGPYQFPEKLIPLIIRNALKGEMLPVYGDGGNVRDWLYVEDHCAVLRAAVHRGQPGQTYNVGARSERRNLDLVHTVCSVLDELYPASNGVSYGNLVRLVEDRPGHDRRYAIDPSKAERELGWKPVETFASGIRKTVAWYLSHRDWIEEVTTGAYRDWIDLQYTERAARALEVKR